MRYFKRMFLVFIITALGCLPIKAKTTIEELFFDNSIPFHLKVLNVIPKDGIVQIGDENVIDYDACRVSGNNCVTPPTCQGDGYCPEIAMSSYIIISY